MLIRVAAAGRGMGDVSLWSCLNPFDPNCAAALSIAAAPYVQPGQPLSWLVPSTGAAAAPPAPSPAMLAAPWNGDVSQQQQDMVNQQMLAQQALNAAGVQTTSGSVIGGGLYNAGQAVGIAAPWVGLALVGLGILALIVLLKVK